MTVCKFWLQGNCRYGNYCRFEHAEPASNRASRYDGGRDRDYGYENRNYRQSQQHPQQSNIATGTSSLQEILSNLKQEIESCERGNQWPFSCFSPIKDGCNYPGLEDTSPEEMRFSAYNFQLQNDTQSYLQHLQRMRNDTNVIRQSLKNPKGNVLQILEQMHKGSLVQSTPSQNEHQFGAGKRMTSLSRADASSFKFDLSRLDSAPPQIPAGNFGFFSGNGNAGNVPQTFGTGTNVGFGSSGASSPTFQMDAVPTPSSVGLFGSGPTLTQNTGFVQSDVFAAPQRNVFTAPVTTDFNVIQHVRQGRWHSQMIFSPLESLSADEKSEFSAPNFTIGFVPTVPPPQEMCL